MCLGFPLPIHISEPEPVCVRARVRPRIRSFVCYTFPIPNRRVFAFVFGFGLVCEALHAEPEQMLVLVWARPCVCGLLPVLFYIRTRISIMHSGLR